MLYIANNMDIDILKKLGFSDKSATVYLALLSLGPSSVRKLAEICQINRGTTYDVLRWLREKGLVDFHEKDAKQYFVAENPNCIVRMVRDEKEMLAGVEKKMDKFIPELLAIYHHGVERPVAKYYEAENIQKILEDILAVCAESEEKMYRIYSAEGVRKYLYEDFPTFSDVRIAKGIAVRVIAMGEGGELRGLDERKWLVAKNDTPTYIIIYQGKTAYISLNAQREPLGVVIENSGISETQKKIFDELWEKI